MAKRRPVPELIPDHPTLAAIRDAAHDCRACDLYKRGTQTVFGEGPRKAEMMLVGEQPGDAEDVAGHPFVGPAGKLLGRALEEAGIDRTRVYVTNIVKHFKWEPRGKRRIHAKPNGAEIAACRPWLETEIALVKPRSSCASAPPRRRRCSASRSGSRSSADALSSHRSRRASPRRRTPRRFFARRTTRAGVPRCGGSSRI